MGFCERSQAGVKCNAARHRTWVGINGYFFLLSPEEKCKCTKLYFLNSPPFHFIHLLIRWSKRGIFSPPPPRSGISRLLQFALLQKREGKSSNNQPFPIPDI